MPTPRLLCEQGISSLADESSRSVRLVCLAPIRFRPPSNCTPPPWGRVVEVTTSGGCQWSVFNTNTWITITSSEVATNNGTVTYTIAANPNAVLRAGTLQIAGHTYLVEQSAAVCVYALSPTNRVHSGTAGSGTANVVAPGGCPWTATSNDGWITISAGATGEGTGTVTYALGAIPTSIPRSGSFSVNGATFVVGQAGSSCEYDVAPLQAGYGATLATGLVTVTTLAGCSWESSTGESWISISSGAVGTGNGTVGYTVSANPTLVARSGILTVAGRSLVVTQAAAVCSFVIAPTTASHGPGLATGSATVTTISGCEWGTTNNNSWITITGGATGVGNGTVTYTLATNPTASARSGQITIAGELLTVNQAGAVCDYALLPSNRSHTRPLKLGVISVASITGCSWTASASPGWITILSGASGSGAGSISYMVAENSSTASRAGTITVAGEVFTVNQAGVSCNFVLTPPAWVHRVGVESGVVHVSVYSQCVWTVSNTNSWLDITSGTNGTGSGSVSYSVTANTGANARAGVITIGGQPFAVSQGGSACTLRSRRPIACTDLGRPPTRWL